MKRKIYVTLFGGLGNQLFQYACAVNLARSINAKLIVDDISGFIFDGKFKRNLSLPNNFKIIKANILEVFILTLIRILKKIFFNKKLFITFTKFIILDETKEKKYIKNFDSLFKNFTTVYLIGFFQSDLYFLKNKNFILKKILENKIQNKKLLKLKKKITRNSLMIGIRVFEEAPKKNMYNFGGVEKFSFYNPNKSEFKNKLKKIYIFTTANDKIIRDNVKFEYKIINRDNGYFGSDFENLLLMSHFNNYIISNSTYYWWAAYLANYKNKIIVKCSKKFTNKDTILKSWK